MTWDTSNISGREMFQLGWNIKRVPAEKRDDFIQAARDNLENWKAFGQPLQFVTEIAALQMERERTP